MVIIQQEGGFRTSYDPETGNQLGSVVRCWER
jgi:hypothetical protein